MGGRGQAGQGAAGERWAGRAVTAARQRWAPRLPLPCWHCKRPVVPGDRWVVEHIRPRSQGGSHTDVGNQWVSHRSCSDASGGRLAQSNKRDRTRSERREYRDWTRAHSVF